ncbi:hypothetical protein BN1708_019460, partial [Verticillium longisporum]
MTISIATSRSPPSLSIRCSKTYHTLPMPKRRSASRPSSPTWSHLPAKRIRLHSSTLMISMSISGTSTGVSTTATCCPHWRPLPVPTPSRTPTAAAKTSPSATLPVSTTGFAR